MKKPREHTCPVCSQSWTRDGKNIKLVDASYIRAQRKLGVSWTKITEELGISIKLAKKEAAFNGDGGME